MCVLNLYSQDNNNDACRFLKKLNITRFSKNSNNILIKYNNKCQVEGKLKYFAAEYSLRGNLIGYKDFDVSNLQLCNLALPYQSPISTDSLFSTKSINQYCSLTVEKLLEIFNKEPSFFELFLNYNTNDATQVMVSINNVSYSRFFLVDSISSKPKVNEKPNFIRYAKSITLSYNLVENNSIGEIYPPKLLIDYDYVKTDDTSKLVQIEFKIKYEMDLKNQFKNFYIALGVLSGLGFIWSIFEIYRWNKRAGKYAIDLITIFKFLMFLLGTIANCFSYLIVGTCIYWLISYRAQKIAFLFLPLESQERIFTIFLVLATVLKTVDVLHMILLQVSYDITFIDWEKPKHNQNERSLPLRGNYQDNNKERSREQIQSDDINKLNQISCWRTLFVANEWNEIQVYRKINPTFQILLVIFLLKGVNLENLSVRDCNYNLSTNDYQTGYSRILRVGIASSLFLAVELFQLIFYYLFYSRIIEDKIGKFIDFCSISNVSMLILPHTQYGYYIHGRSPQGFADTSMFQMIQGLSKEEFNLMSKRGLEGSEHQTFSVFISLKFSRLMYKIIGSLNEVNFCFI